MNLFSCNLEYLFKDNEDYTIETVKSMGVLEPKRWSEAFGKALTKNIVDAKILHTLKGLTLPLKRFSTSKDRQVLEVAGLYSYNEESKLKQEFLKGFSHKLQDCFINRIDICIDLKVIPQKVFKNLNNKREKTFSFKNTNYWKTYSEGKTNPRMDVKIYNKALKEKLRYPLFRLEFCFKKPYIGNIRLSELDRKLLSKMEKTICNFSGLKVRIEPLYTHA